MGTDIRLGLVHKTPEGWRWLQKRVDVERNYYLFAWLSGETNDRLLDRKSIKTPIKPIAEPRGMPTDIDPIDTSNFSEYNGSWLSADEVLSATIPTIVECGMLTLDEYKLWDGKSNPQSQGLDLLYPANPLKEPYPDPNRWIAHFNDPSSFLDKTTHVYIEFEFILSHGFGYFLYYIKSIAEKHKEEVRLVFDYMS